MSQVPEGLGNKWMTQWIADQTEQMSKLMGLSRYPIERKRTFVVQLKKKAQEIYETASSSLGYDDKKPYMEEQVLWLMEDLQEVFINHLEKQITSLKNLQDKETLILQKVLEEAKEIKNLIEARVEGVMPEETNKTKGKTISFNALKLNMRDENESPTHSRSCVE